MPYKRVTPIRFWNGSAWTEGMVPVYNDKGTYKMNRLWYSNDGLNWAPTDQADVVMTPPTVPNSFSASTVSSTQIDLAWTAPATPNDLSGYKVVYASGATAPANMTSGTQACVVSDDVLSYAHTGLTGSTQYSYRLAGTTSDGQYGATRTATATTNASYTDYYQEFGITGVGAYGATAGWEAQSYAGRVRQGNTTTNTYTGEWYYGAGLKNAINGATILNGDFRVSRQTASGPTGAMTLQVGLHGNLSRPASCAWNGAAPATTSISRLEFKWWHGGGGGSQAANWANHIANDINGAWRGMQCGGYGADINYTYVSYGGSATASDNDPAGQFRVWWRRYG